MWQYVLFIAGIFIGIPFLFGEPTGLGLFFGGSITLFGIVFYLKNGLIFQTRYKKKSIAGRVVDKTKKVAKKAVKKLK